MIVKRKKFLSVAAVIALAITAATLIYYLSTVVLPEQEVRVITRADTIYELNFSSSSRFDDKLFLKMGVTVVDINSTAEVDLIKTVFATMPIFFQIVNPNADTIRNTNFQSLMQAEFMPFLSSSSMADLNALASTFFQIYPNKTAVFELTSRSAVNKQAIESFKATFPNSKFYASNFTNWNREEARRLVGQYAIGDRLCAGETNSNAIPFPALDGLSYHIDLLQRGQDTAEDIAIFWDEMFDASRDIEGASIKVCWPNKRYNLAISEIKFTPQRDNSETSFFGVMLDAFFNYASVRGGEPRETAGVPISYVGVGGLIRYSQSALSILKVMSLMTKDQMLIVHPQTGSGVNLRDNKPFYRLVGYKEGVGFKILLVNAQNSNAVAKFPENIDFSGYRSFSTKRGTEPILGANKQAVLNPYEVVSFYTGNISEPPVPPVVTQTPNPLPTATLTMAPQTTPPTATLSPSPTNTLAPSPTRTLTPIPTNTPTLSPTQTPTSSPTPTNTPTPSNTPTPTFTPTITPTPTPLAMISYSNTASTSAQITMPTELAVNNQQPGVNPLVFLIPPALLLILGLLF